VENEIRYSRKYHCESHESREKRKMRYIVKLASLAILKLVMILASLATKFLFARLIRSESHYELCLKAREKQVSLQNFCLRDS
jgi:hypothetical protein